MEGLYWLYRVVVYSDHSDDFDLIRFGDDHSFYYTVVSSQLWG